MLKQVVHIVITVLKVEENYELQQKISKCGMTDKWRFLEKEPNPCSLHSSGMLHSIGW
jgi:hypothetical protein